MEDSIMSAPANRFRGHGVKKPLPWFRCMNSHYPDIYYQNSNN